MNKKRLLLTSLSMLLAVAVYAEVPVVEESNNFSVNQQDEPFIAEKPVANAQVAEGKYDAETVANEQESKPAQAATKEDNALLLAKLNAMQQELQELRGQIEVQAHDMKLLQQQQLAFYKDLDSRIGSGNEASNASSPMLSQNKSQANKTAEVASKTRSANPADEQVSYVAAYELIKQKQYDKAVESMSAFLQDYPQSTYAANAHYWLGELYLLKQNYEKALDQFNTVVKDYPNSTKIAASTLKLGFAYAAMGNIEGAKKYLRQVQEQFPDTSTAQLAKSKLATL